MSPPNRSYRTTPRRKLCLLGLLLVSTVWSKAEPARAQSEDEVKAAFLLNFARYVEWPASAFDSAEAALRICLLGSDGFESVVSNTVAGKIVHDRSVEVEAVHDGVQAGRCHLLFVDEESLSRSEEEALLRDLRQANVFTVGSREGFASRGGVANFYRAGNKIRFEVNPSSADDAGLEVSSRLLRLARIVESR